MQLRLAAQETLIDANMTDIASAGADWAKRVSRFSSSGINLKKEIHKRTFQIRLMQSQCSSFNIFSPRFCMINSLAPTYFLSRLLSPTREKKKKKK